MTFGGDFRLKPRSVVKGLWPVVVFLMLNTLSVVEASNFETRQFYDQLKGEYRYCYNVNCEAGQEPTICKDNLGSGTCHDCIQGYWQADKNSLFEKKMCRLKTNCDHEIANVDTKDSKTIDHTCKCQYGFHLAGKSQCLPNRICAVGLGQTGTESCESCSQKGDYYSDTKDKYQPCLPLTRCMECVLLDSNHGTRDNRCGRIKDGECILTPENRTVVTSVPVDITQLTLTLTTTASDTHDKQTSRILVIVLVPLTALAIAIAIVCCCCPKKLRGLCNKASMLLHKEKCEQVLIRAENDDAFAANIWRLTSTKIQDHLVRQQRYEFFRDLYGHEILRERSALWENFESETSGHTERDKAYELLKQWRQQMGEAATLRCLFSALKKRCPAALKAICDAAPIPPEQSV